MDCEMKEYGSTLAIATVPWQKWEKVMCADEGLMKGTIFEELFLPFHGIQAACDSRYTNSNQMQRHEHNYHNDMRRNNIGRGCGCR